MNITTTTIKNEKRSNKMDITTTRVYNFTAAELLAIKVFCQLADSIAISENMDYNNKDYYVQDFFHKKYEEYVMNGECTPTFEVNS